MLGPRVAVLPPAPAPYREPLFARLAQRGVVDLEVVYLTSEQPSWDQGEGWFGGGGGYERSFLGSWQRARGRSGRTPILFPRGLRCALERIDPEVIVSWEYGPTTLAVLAWSAVRRRRVVLFSELTPEADAVIASWQLRLHRLLAPRVAGLIVASGAAGRRAQALGVDADRIEVSLQSADLDRFTAAGAAAARGGEGPVRLLTVSRLVEDKNVAGLLRGVARARLDPGSVVVEVYGTGPLEADLRTLADRLGVEARFRGYASPAQLPAAYAAADAFALTSSFEPFGVAVREAAASGLPLLCTQVAGAAGDIAVSGRNAFLVDPADEQAIADAVASLVTDRELRERMGRESELITAERDPVADAQAFERAVVRASRSA